MSKVVKRSGLQNSVLALYRKCLHSILDPNSTSPSVRDTFYKLLKEEFANNASIPKTNFSRIEERIQQGEKFFMETLSRSSIVDFKYYEPPVKPEYHQGIDTHKKFGEYLFDAKGAIQPLSETFGKISKNEPINPVLSADPIEKDLSETQTPISK